MTDEDKLLIETLYKEGLSPTAISKKIEGRFATTSIKAYLVKQGIFVAKKSAYQNRMTDEDRIAIGRLYDQGLGPTAISRELGGRFSNTTIRNLLNKQGKTTKKALVDRSRPCKICGKTFTPKHQDGKKKDKYVYCSIECGRKEMSQANTKYTQTEINKVIHLKKLGQTNNDISEITGVNVNKIKEIVRENDLYLTSETAQDNAYRKKLERNPNAMEDMRNAYSTTVRGREALSKLKNELQDRGFEYVSGFDMRSKGFKIKCNACNGVKEVSRIDAVVKGACKMCVGTSKGETELRQWIESLGVGTAKKTYIYSPDKKRKEIDIYIPELKIGIEYCGLYWHSEQGSPLRGSDYHYNKMKLAEENGITLITIFEDEWTKRKNQVKNLLRDILCVNVRSVHADNYQVKPVDHSVASAFLEDNHIQGTAPMEIALGLYGPEGLVGVITGNGVEDQFQISRIATQYSTHIIGGIFKLISHLIDHVRGLGIFSDVVLLSDNRLSNGNIYSYCGFTLVEEIQPDYSYVCGSERIPKQNRVGLTKSENYHRIWNCGEKKWSINIK